MSKQEQKSGDNSTNIQANGIVINQGLSYSEVRDVVLDAIQAKFIELAGKAQDIARTRAEEVTENFLLKLQKENPTGFTKAEDPDFQHALFTVQREYARTGEKELGDLLVDLLVDRSKQDHRGILQIVLNESLSTAPKLTNSQLAVLAIVFLFKYTQYFGIGNHQQLGEYFDRHVSSFASNIVKNSSCYQHLEFTGCGSIQISEQKLELILGSVYQGQFLKGFDVSEISTREITIGRDARFFIPCLNDPTKIQVRANNKEQLEKDLDAHSIASDDRAKIIELFDLGKMSEGEIREKCVSIRPYMANVFDVWANSPMKSFTLTSVGMAIGHANIKRLIGEFASLDIWIN